MKNIRVKISTQVISCDEVLGAVSSRKAGGTVMFVGTVRDNSDGMRINRVEIESAARLAKIDLERISGCAMKKFDILKVAVAHRVGVMRIGETIVAIAVSAAHRKDAFAASKFIIDELKKTTPIWKKESGPSGHRWVEGKR